MLRRKPTVVELRPEDKAEYEAVKAANDAVTAKLSQNGAQLTVEALQKVQSTGFPVSSAVSSQPHRN